jgi:hypothetical protein
MQDMGQGFQSPQR